MDAVVLALHRRDRRGVVAGQPLLEQGPEHTVLAGVVVVQEGGQEVEVAGDGARPGQVAVGHAAHETGREGVLGAEGAVHDDHVAGVDQGGGGGAHGAVLADCRERRGPANVSERGGRVERIPA
nr:hypothetical protein [uncultured Nocardioides sp.]